MNDLRCVIFDVDGTLTQTNELIYESFNYIAQKYLGKTYSIPEIVALFGPPEEVCIEKLVGKKFVPEACEDYYRYYSDNFHSKASIYPRLIEVLETLRSDGIVMGVFTGKGRMTTEITLDKLGIKQFFDMIVTGTDVVKHKPAEEGILKILNHFKLKPEEALMVGDAVADIVAARKAGVRIASVVWDSYAPDQVIALEPDIIFHSVDELLEWTTVTLHK